MGESPPGGAALRSLRVLLVVVLALVAVWVLGRFVYPEPKAFGPQVRTASRMWRVDPKLTLAVIQTESHFQAGATSKTGARGLMQIMPATGKWLWPKVFSNAAYHPSLLDDPEVNIALGTYYLGVLLKTYDGNVSMALAAYNGGGANVKRWIQSTDRKKTTFLSAVSYPETKRFVVKVWVAYVLYHILYPWS